MRDTAKIIFFVLCVLMLHLNVSGRQNQIDSLIKLSREPVTSEELLSINNQLGNKLRQAYPDSAIRYYKRSLALAKLLNSTKDYIRALNSIGVAWALANNFDSAFHYTQTSIELSHKNKFSSGVAHGHNNLGLFEIKRHQCREALPFLFEAIEVIDGVEDYHLESKIYNNLGLAYKRLHKYDSSLFYYLESLKIKEGINDLNGIGITTSNIALVYEKLEDYDLSVEYLNRSLKIREQTDNAYGQGIVLNNLGLIYEKRNYYDTALTYYLKSCEIFEQTDRKARIATCYNNIGSMYAQLTNYKKAIEYLNRSLQININTNNISGQAHSYLDMAGFYGKIKNYSKSVFNYKKSLQLAQSLDNFDAKIEAFDGLYKVYELAGNADSALHYYRWMNEFKDSLSIDESKERVEILEIQYQTLKKEQENEQLIKANQINKSKIRQGFLTVTLLAVFLVFFIVITFVTAHNRNKIKKAVDVILKQKTEIETQTKELEVAYDEMKSLVQFKEETTGMIVHDLKNPINTIINIADAANSKETKLLIKHSSKKMLNLVMNILDVQRYEDAGIELNTQNTEMRYVLYKAIDELKFNAQLKRITIALPKTVDYVVDIDVPIFERVLINLLTNALKFSPEDSKIEIKYELMDRGFFKIHIIDKGTGIDKDFVPIIFDKFKQAEKRSVGMAGSTGIGLSFCKMAIESHGGEIGVDSRQKIGSDFWIKLKYLKRVQLGGALVAERDEIEEIELYLSYHVKEILRPYVERISEYLVYQISDIRKILNKVEELDHQVVGLYVEHLNDAVLACDAKKYKNLINLVLSND